MKIVLGVTGGIAAYKAIELARSLIKRGDEVRVVMTSGAQEFVQPLTFQVITQNSVGVELFDPSYESEIGHIEIARWADAVLIAPATANTIAKMAMGMASDLLTTLVLATTAPVLVAPAMNTQMYLNPLVQRNVSTLREIGFHVIDPDVGELACKEVGAGRLPDAWVLMEALDAALSPQILAGKSVLISAGPTREHLDPARYISNPSTGRMGFALARAARCFGARVKLVTGPSELLTPVGVTRIDVGSAQEMYENVSALAASQDYVVMSAAVADWRPVSPKSTKQTKSEMSGNVELERTPDILLELGESYGVDSAAGPLVIGFAAETHDVEKRGQEKRKRKKAHMFVANKIGGVESTFGSDTSTAFVITSERSQALPSMSKDELARQIWLEAKRLAR